MDKTEYTKKLNDILKDKDKFQVLKKNPINNIKKEVNNLTEISNKMTKETTFKPIIGDFEPGYLYGNVKTHKPGNKLRPIISQVTTPTYDVSKIIDTIVKPYIPSTYMLKSRDEFINILTTNTPTAPSYSLDVESLFTNVPVLPTIDIILKHTYEHPTIPPPKVPRDILRELLIICTTKVPFTNVDGKMYIQKDGVSMGSPLGPTFANYYMAELETKVFAESSKPNIYARYVDDIFCSCTEEELKRIKEIFEEKSVLKFTYEAPQNNKLPFLDILVDSSDGEYSTSIYIKSTDAGRCLNYHSECPDRYKNSVIQTYIRRAWLTAKTWYQFDAEIKHIKQMLVNNNYPNKIIDEQLKQFLDTAIQEKSESNTLNKHQLYYRNQYNTKYKVDEEVIKRIVKENVSIVDNTSSLSLLIYYKNMKTHQLVMRNNLVQTRPLNQSNLTYEYKCNIGECKHLTTSKNSYIGFTKCKLTRRLSYHLCEGAIQKHCIEMHKRKITRKEIEENTKIRYKVNDTNRLQIYEALLIYVEKPILNQQDTGKSRTLHLFA